MLSSSLLAFVLIAPTFEAPLDLPRGIPIVTLRANQEQELRLIVDTGAGRSVIDSSKAQALGLESIGAIEATGTGGATQAKIFDGFRVELGAEKLNLPAIGLPLGLVATMLGARFDGILGYEFFQRRIVEIDYAAQRMRTYRRIGFTPPQGATPATFRIESGRPMTDVTLRIDEGHELRAVLMVDTGANSPLSLTRSFATEHRLAVVEAAGMIGGVGGARKTYRTPVGRVRLGDVWLEIEGALVSDKTVTGAAGLLGSGALQRRRLILDYDGGRLWLTAPAPHTPES